MGGHSDHSSGELFKLVIVMDWNMIRRAAFEVIGYLSLKWPVVKPVPATDQALR